MRGPVVRDTEVTALVSAGQVSALRIRFWTPLSHEHVQVSLYRVHLAALDDSGIVRILECMIDPHFTRKGAPGAPLPLYYDGPLPDEFCYELTCRALSASAQHAVQRFCSEDGRIAHATSVWFEDVVGHVGTPDRLRFGREDD
jgi:hypothetical protein